MEDELRLPVKYSVTFRDKSRNKSLITVFIENTKESLFNKLGKRRYRERTKSSSLLSIPIRKITFDNDQAKNTHPTFYCIPFSYNLLSKNNEEV